MANKIIGYAFLFFGVIIILWGLWFSYKIFTGAKPAPDLFKASQNAKIEIPNQPQLNAVLQSQLGQLLAGDSMNKILNLTAWSIFMAILIMACGKISTIGVKLLKENKKETLNS